MNFDSLNDKILENSLQCATKKKLNGFLNSWTVGCMFLHCTNNKL